MPAALALPMGPRYRPAQHPPHRRSPPHYHQELFYLVVADSGSDFDGDYITSSGDDAGGVVLYPQDPPDDFSYTLQLAFHITDRGTLGILDDEIGIYTGIPYPSLDLWPYSDPADDNPPNQPNARMYCGVVGGTLSCQADSRTVFSLCPDDRLRGGVTGRPVDIGLTAEPGCAEVTLLVVPV